MLVGLGYPKMSSHVLLLGLGDRLESDSIRCPTIVSAGRLGLLSIFFEFVKEGRRIYLVGDGSNRYQFIYAGDLATDTITYMATDGSTQQVTVSITGTDDNSVITGTATGAVTEGNVGDAPVTATGSISISDIDADDSPTFNDVAGTVGDNGYGSFQLTGGTWTYTLDQSAVQYLDAGESVTDTITYTATDGATQVVTVTVNGSEDLPTLDNAISNQSATEDTAFSFTFAAVTFGDLDASDNLSFTTTLSDGVTPLPGWLSFVDNGDGTGTFNGTPTNGDVGTVSIRLVASDGVGSVNDTFDIVVGNTNDAPVFGGTETGAVTEDVDPDVDTLLETSGTLTIVDPDAGESSFQAGTVSGTYGSLTIDTAGNWAYSADNTQAAIQQLDVSETLTDTLTVTFREVPVAESDEDKPGVILDYDAEGHLVSVEVLDASLRVEEPRSVSVAGAET